MPPAPLITELWVCVVGCIEAYVVMGVRRSKFVPTSLSGEVREGLGIGPGGSWDKSGRVLGGVREGPGGGPGGYRESSGRVSGMFLSQVGLRGPFWSPLGGSLGAFWGPEGPSWRSLEPSWGALGQSWGRVWGVLGHLGAFLGRLGGVFGIS